MTSRHGRKRDAGQPGSQPVTHDYRPGGAGNVTLVNKGDADTRPVLGSGYERVDPVMPHRPVVPAGAPGALRLDAKKSDIIPEYPY